MKRKLVICATCSGGEFVSSLTISHSDNQFYCASIKGNYSDGQPYIKLALLPPEDSDIVVVGNTQGAQQLVELLTLMDTIRRNKSLSSKMVVLIPYFGAGRQDRAKNPGEDVAAEMQATLISSMLPDAVILMDLHNSGIRGFFDKKILVREIYAEPVFLEAIKAMKLENFVVASPDAGRFDWARSYAEKLGTEAISLRKLRIGPGQVSFEVVGREEVEGKNVVMIDDILDTGNTVFKGAEILRYVGAKDIHLFVTHPVLSGGPRFKFLSNSLFASLHTTNTIANAPSGFQVHSIVPLFAKAIREIFGIEKPR